MSFSKRILVVSEAWPPTSGGVATSTQRISTNLAKLGIDVTVFTFDSSHAITDPEYQLETSEGGVRLVRFGPFFLKRPNEEIRGLSEKHRAIMRRRVFDAMEIAAQKQSFAGIISFYVVNAGWLATYLSRSLNIPHILGVRGNDIGRNIFASDRLAPVAMAVDGASTIVCVNEHLRRRLLLAFPKVADKTNVILNGTFGEPTEQSREHIREDIARQTGWSATSPWAVFIGTPREKKGLQNLLEAMLSLPENHELRLLCIGPEPGALEMRVCGAEWKRLKESGRLFCTGQLPRTEALRLAAGGDIVVMPSVEDGLANGLLEGMSLGLCPVASDIFSDVLRDGENGLVVPRGNKTALANALLRAAGDSQLRHDLGCVARELAITRHSPRREAEDYLQILRGLGI
jgi:glycosyltransferase involved in cell wall biosynthesis